MKRKVLSIFILSANLLNLTAQNMTNSPASMFGLGELSTGEGGIYSGMGVKKILTTYLETRL